jgi:hypothetical protein
MLLLALCVVAAPLQEAAAPASPATEDPLAPLPSAELALPPPLEATPAPRAAPRAEDRGVAEDEVDEDDEPAPARRRHRSALRRKATPAPKPRTPSVNLEDRVLAGAQVGAVTLGLQLALVGPAAAVLVGAVLALSAASLLSVAMVWGSIGGTMAFFVALGSAHVLVVVMAALVAAGLSVAASAVAAKAGSNLGPPGTYRVQVLRALVPQGVGAALAVVALGLTGVVLAVLSAPALLLMMAGRDFNVNSKDPRTINLGGYMVAAGCVGAMAPWFVLAPLGVVAAALAQGLGLVISAVVAGVGAGADVEPSKRAGRRMTQTEED